MLTIIRRLIKSQSEFTKRIKNRHREFWSADNAEEVRNSPVSVEDSLHKWQDVINWQRKLSNKYNAKVFAQKLGCKVSDLYWRGSDVKQIDFTRLPEQYVIRPTIGHSSKGVFLMNNGFNFFDQKSYTPEAIRAVLEQQVQQSPKLEFLVEEFLQETPGEYKVLSDYKFFCFNGEIASCQLINRTGPKAGFSSFYDEHWNPMEAVHPGYTLVPPQPAPASLEEMVDHVKKLSRAYRIFCRIDFYATTKGAVFGEFTPTPALGQGYSRFGQKLLIKHWDKYCQGLI